MQSARSVSPALERWCRCIQPHMLPFTESGAGETVLVFLHFFGSSRREWRHVTERLASTHRCIAADMPGFGEAAGIAGYSVAEMAAHIRTLVEYFAPAPVVLVAHSFSGKVRMVLAAEPPANLCQAHPRRAIPAGARTHHRRRPQEDAHPQPDPRRRGSLHQGQPLSLR